MSTRQTLSFCISKYKSYTIKSELIFIVFSFLSIFILITPSFSETKTTITLKNGQTFKGDIIKDNEVTITLEVKDSQIKIYKDQILDTLSIDSSYNISEETSNKKRKYGKDTIFVDKLNVNEIISVYRHFLQEYFTFQGNNYRLNNKNLKKIYRLIPCEKANDALKRSKIFDSLKWSLLLVLSPLEIAVFNTLASVNKEAAIRNFNECIKSPDTKQTPYILFKSKNRFSISPGWNITFFKEESYMGPEMEIGIYLNDRHFFGVCGQGVNLEIPSSTQTIKHQDYYEDIDIDFDNGGGGLLYYFSGLPPNKGIMFDIGATIGYWFFYRGVWHYLNKPEEPEEYFKSENYHVFGGPKVKILLGVNAFNISSTYTLLLGTSIFNSVSFHMNIGIRRNFIQYLND